MIDATVQRLLEQAINSPIKLQLLLMFHDNAWMEWSATRIAERIYCDIWSTRAALGELTEDGILINTAVLGGEPLYRYRPCVEHTDAIARLCYCYDEPLERDDVQRLVREVASYARYCSESAAISEADFSPSY